MSSERPSDTTRGGTKGTETKRELIKERKMGRVPGEKKKRSLTTLASRRGESNHERARQKTTCQSNLELPERTKLHPKDALDEYRRAGTTAEEKRGKEARPTPGNTKKKKNGNQEIGGDGGNFPDEKKKHPARKKNTRMGKRKRGKSP